MKFKRKTIGTWLQINSNEILNLLKNSSFDWVVFDLEHGNIAIDDLATLVQIAKYNNLIPFCRLSKPCENEAMLVLEKGIEGIIFPRIKDEKECLRLSNACLYPPKGNRGVGFSISNNFGLNLKKNIKTFKPLIIMMIENTTSYLNLKKIINLKNIDGIFIGPYDLSASLGCLGNFEHSLYKNCIKNIISSTKKKNKLLGFHVVEPDPKKLKKAIKDFNFVAYSIDTVVIRKFFTNPLK